MHRIAGRFALERIAGSGGMGTVYLARDDATGERVAVKVLRGAGTHEIDRFAREARLLAEIRHPGVVRYIAHGVANPGDTFDAAGHEPGARYIAMEWLDGEDLDTRLVRQGLTIAESVAMARQVAETLAAVHAHGVVHRDIKPANLFLAGGQIDAVKILDFGIARAEIGIEARTRTGDTVGTPGYMAPEQASGERDIDARADLFSLGCVLFECLTGTPAFQGDHVFAVLAKLLLDQAPPIRSLAPDVPLELEALVGRLLSKDPAGRPKDATQVAAELAACFAMVPESVAQRARAGALSQGVTGTEQRLASVLLVAPARRESVHSRVSGAEGAVLAIAVQHGASCDRLVDGTLVMTTMGGGAATDQAARAAQCAIAVRAALPGRPMALSTGRAMVGGPWPMGEVIDRAARLLWFAEHDGRGAQASLPIWLDALTAGLLDARFDVASEGEAHALSGAHEPTETARTLLGKPTRCVGRERELPMLLSLFEECASEPAARAVVVTAPAGVGKSRLRHELLQRVAASGQDVAVWIGRGCPMRASCATLGMLGQIVRRAAGLHDSEPIDMRRDKLRACVARHVDVQHRSRVTEFLGEMIATPFPDAESLQLRAARRDPMLLGDQMRRAWVDFLEAECRAHPVLLVLEDLHWGDRPSVDYVDTALRLLHESPLLVLALARPELDDTFPGLFRERDLTQMRLPELSRKACEQLVRQVLGDQVTKEAVAKFWERSTGNAFFLEELLRAHVEGRGDAPETVLAMVQSRLEALDPEARRVLRAGSLFGRVFWRGAASAVLGSATRALELDRWLQELEHRELITALPEARFQDEREYVFRHALVREAAYGMLTDDDRTLGHQLAGAWLERMGETNAGVVADHFDRGDDPARAIVWYRRAGAQALEANDLAGAIERAERGLSCGAMGETLGELALILAEAHGWRAEAPQAEQFAKMAMAELPAGSPHWFAAVREWIAAASKLGHLEPLSALGRDLLAGDSDSGATGPAVIAMARASLHLFNVGEYDLAWALHGRLEALADRFCDDPPVAAVIGWARAARALFAGDSGSFLELNKQATTHYEQAGDLRSACNQRVGTGYACNELGAYAEAATVLRAALADAERMGLANVVIIAKHNLGLSLAHLGALEEARTVEQDAADRAAAAGVPRLEGAACIYLTTILELSGDLAGAEAQARTALDKLATAPPILAYALAKLAVVLLGQGRAPEAIEHAQRAADLLASLGLIEEGEAIVRLAHAEALEANGEHEAARKAIAVAQMRLHERAGKIKDPVLRASFLERVPDHARTLARAAQWLN